MLTMLLMLRSIRLFEFFNAKNLDSVGRGQARE